MLCYHHAMLLLLVLNIDSRSAFIKHIERYRPGRYAWSLCCWRPTSGAAHNVVLWARLRCVGHLVRSAILLGSWRLSLPCYLGHPPFCHYYSRPLTLDAAWRSRPFVTLLDVPDSSCLSPLPDNSSSVCHNQYGTDKVCCMWHYVTINHAIMKNIITKQSYYLPPLPIWMGGWACCRRHCLLCFSLFFFAFLCVS